MKDEALSRLLAPPKNARLSLDSLPEGERKIAQIVQSNLADLAQRAQHFWSALQLLSECQTNAAVSAAQGNLAQHSKFQTWTLTAARDGAMSVYHFGRTLEGIDKSLPSCPSLRALIDERLLKEPRSKFLRSFPYFIPLRHAVAHAGERTSTPKELKKHAAGGGRVIELGQVGIMIPMEEDAYILIPEQLIGTRFVSMWEGEVVSLEMVAQTGRILDEISDAYWNIFEPAIDRSPPAAIEPTVTVTPGHTPPFELDPKPRAKKKYR